ncbi:MAG: hypothetical protein L6Q33_01120 [Bacteriovoracaceae bacterium]|nr:hypothetical protein [Bacteriovoracaceae bacterium]
MSKLLWIIKLLPVLTILHGFLGSGSRFGSLLDTLKVALTQYELSNITKLYVEEAGDIGKESFNPQRFIAFVNDNYHNQYSVFARDFVGSENSELSFDIWGTPFQLELVATKSKLKIYSAGPDKKIKNKDDISVDIVLDVPPEMLQSPSPQVAKNPPVEAKEEPQQLETERFPADDQSFEESTPSDMGSNLQDGRENPYVQDQPQDEIIDYENEEDGR